MRQNSKNYLISIRHNTREHSPGDGEIKTPFPTYQEAATFAERYTKKQGEAIIWDIEQIHKASIYKDPKEAREVWKRGRLVCEEYKTQEYDYTDETPDSEAGYSLDARRDTEEERDTEPEFNRNVPFGREFSPDYEDFV